MLWLSLLLLFGLVAAACGGPAEVSNAAPVDDTAAAAAPAPDLFSGSFIDLNGESIDLASFEGQDVVLWYWAPW